MMKFTKNLFKKSTPVYKNEESEVLEYEEQNEEPGMTMS